MASSSSSSNINDSAIDALIAEATDLCTLEQIAALNAAHLSDSSLPSNLESRFQKLKSFPPTTTPLPQPTHQEDKENIPECFNPRETEPDSSDQDPKPETEEVVKPRRGSPSPSPSPPRQVCGCFSFSPKRVQRRERSGGDDEISEILSGVGSESMKENRRKLKKAWREHEKASREAEKMVKWVKQVSARINEAAIDELMKEEFK